MANPFAPATKKRAKLRLALMGTSGSGKTYTALSVASVLGRIAVIDTERGSASKYAGLFQFDVLELTTFHPQQYIEAIKAATDAGYDVVVIDSLSHAWSGTGGALEIVDRVTKQSKSQNSYMAWGEVTPLHNKLIDAMIGAPLHVIATMRSKTEYVLEKDDKGKSTPRKVGLAPVQRDGMEYEFDVVGELDMQNTLTITKTRVPALANGVIPTPGAALGETLLAWLQDGVEAPQGTELQQPPPQPATRPTAPQGTPVGSSPNGSPSSTQSGTPSGDDFAKQFPAGGKWTAIMLYEAMQDYFDNEHHFREHWRKHEAEYNGLTLAEASAQVRILHWNYDVDKVKALCAWANAALGMSATDVTAALGVKKFREWKNGSYAEACDACTVWAEKQAAKDLQQEGGSAR